MDINSTPSITLAVNNDSVDNLYNYVNGDIVPEIEKLTSVASVDVSGGQEAYIKAELIPEKLSQYHVNMNTIVAALKSADFSMPIGSTSVGNKELSVTSGTSFDTMELLKKIPITLGNGNIIYMEDVANIYNTVEAKDSIGRYDGQGHDDDRCQEKSGQRPHYRFQGSPGDNGNVKSTGSVSGVRRCQRLQ